MLNVTLTNNNNALHKHTRSHAQWSLFLLVACIFRYNYFSFSVARRIFYFRSISFAVECTILSICLSLGVCVWVHNFCSQGFTVYATFSVRNAWYQLPFFLAPLPMHVCALCFIVIAVLLSLVNMYVMPHWCVQSSIFLEQTQFAHFNFVTDVVSFSLASHCSESMCSNREKLQLQMPSCLRNEYWK